MRLRSRVLLVLLLLGLVAAGVWSWQALRTYGEWRQAEAAIGRHDLAAAADHLDRYLARRPGDAAAWFLAARTARRLQRYPEADRYLKRCQEVGGVTDATRLEWDLFRVQQGDLGTIPARLKRTIHPDDPNAPLVLEALARGYLEADRLMDVVEACDLWISCQPDHPWPWLWRGGVQEQLARFHHALADYRRALENAPADRAARLALAGLYARARQPREAVEHYEFVLRQSPGDEEARLGLAACRIDLGQADAALPLLERSLKADPVPARASFLRGKVALEERDVAGAERWLREAVAKAPDDAEALHQLTLALRTQGKHAEADRLAVRLELLRLDLDRLTVLARDVAREPDDAGLRHEAGVISLRIGRTDEGVRWLQSALRARGDHRPTHAALAEHYGKMGDERAERHRRQAKAP